jgi:hypothetical protein
VGPVYQEKKTKSEKERRKEGRTGLLRGPGGT